MWIFATKKKTKFNEYDPSVSHFFLCFVSNRTSLPLVVGSLCIPTLLSSIAECDECSNGVRERQASLPRSGRATILPAR
jgi:hypothetical protein